VCFFWIFAGSLLVHAAPIIFETSFVPIEQGYVFRPLPDRVVSWLVDKKKRLFVTCFSCNCFGSVSQTFMRVRLSAQGCDSMYGDIVYTDYSSGLVLIRVEERYADALATMSEGVVDDGLCQEGQKVKCVTTVGCNDRALSGSHFSYMNSSILDSWAVGKNGVQGFVYSDQGERLPGAAIVNDCGAVVGITNDRNDVGFAIQGRYINAMLKRYDRDPVEMHSRIMRLDRRNNILRLNSDNSYVCVDWCAATLKERLRFSALQESDIDAQYRMYKGCDGRQRHLYLRRGFDGVCTGKGVLRLGDIIWAVWLEGQELPLYGDPFVLIESMCQAQQSGANHIYWTVLRHGKSQKVCVPFSLAKPANKVLVCGHAIFSNEVVDGHTGVCAYVDNMVWLVEHINGVKVMNIHDVQEQLNGVDCAVLGGVLAVREDSLMWYTKPDWGQIFWENRSCCFLSLLGQSIRLFERKNGVWEVQQ